MFLLEDKEERATTHRGSQGAPSLQITTLVHLLQHHWIGDGIALQHVAVCGGDMLFGAAPSRSHPSLQQSSASHGFTVDDGVQTKMWLLQTG